MAVGMENACMGMLVQMGADGHRQIVVLVVMPIRVVGIVIVVVVVIAVAAVAVVGISATRQSHHRKPRPVHTSTAPTT